MSNQHHVLFEKLAPHVSRIVGAHFRSHPLREDLVAVALERLWEILPRIDAGKGRDEQISYCARACIHAAQDELRSPRQRVIRVEDMAERAGRPKGPRSAVVSARIPAGRRRVLEAIAEGRAMTLNDWLKQAIDEKLEREVQHLGLSAAP